MSKTLSWDPVRNGARYCAPACGHGCTFAQFEEATELAKALAERLGPGWEPDVWENAGWHFRARWSGTKDDHSGLRVHGRRVEERGQCHAYYRDFSAPGLTPEKALGALLDKVTDEFMRVEKIREHVRASMGTDAELDSWGPSA